MQTIPAPQDQARILMDELKSKGFTLPYQQALQAIARVMGYKNWKTMSALQAGKPSATPAPAPSDESPADEVVGTEGAVFLVPVSVEMSMTAWIKARGTSEEDAKQAAREHAAAIYPQGFELDDGNHRKLGDFYCGDAEMVLPTEDDFDTATLSVENNFGTLGSLEVTSRCGGLLLLAELQMLESDSSDDDRSAQGMLTVRIRNADEDEELAKVCREYSYHGSYPGNHLKELFESKELLGYLPT
ncbi:hypothetical protein LC612_32485 [Nostoc sp. CHAB 5834]|nr:hypothetical protein [Nostoc sp. CHAB 5834]